MHTQMARLPGRATVGVLLTLLLAGCTTQVDGIALGEGEFSARNVPQDQTAAPTVTNGAGPTVTGQDEQAKAYTTARAIDPCALHHVESASKVTGMPADEIMPGSDLSSCDLAMTPDKSFALSIWDLSISVGVVIGSKMRGEATQEQIGGVSYLHAKELTDDGRSCRYIKDLGPGSTGGAVPSASASGPAASTAPTAGRALGIQLAVSRRSTEAQSKDSCAIAKEYLGEIGKYWANPALRKDKVTTPSFPIADVDPCGSTGDLEGPMGGPVRATPTGPLECEVRLAPGGGNAQKAFKAGVVSTQLTLKDDPRTVLSIPQLAKDNKAITVAGRPGVVEQAGGDPANPKLPGSCRLTVIADENLTVQADASKADAPKSYQLVVTRANSCDLATKASEAVLALLR